MKQDENACRALQWAEEIGPLYFEKGHFCTCSDPICISGCKN